MINKNSFTKNAKVTMWAEEARRVHVLATERARELEIEADQAKADVAQFENMFHKSIKEQLES